MLRVMSRRGDDRFSWPDLNCDSDFLELTDDQRKAVEEAEKVFKEAREKGATGFSKDKHGQFQRVDDFDPFADHIVLVPRVVGG